MGWCRAGRPRHAGHVPNRSGGDKAGRPCEFRLVGAHKSKGQSFPRGLAEDQPARIESRAGLRDWRRGRPHPSLPFQGEGAVAALAEQTRGGARRSECEYDLSRRQEGFDLTLVRDELPIDLKTRGGPWPPVEWRRSRGLVPYPAAV